ncbi:hypothetical protein [Oceanobacillus chungangensis]|uniref:Uncharacterized protein n=1 Tax=Oceanobacillus chungangensis TaxID=1229152 RepID=A0A3D8PUW5_9BACI|nr:hypothetical protein [Oceanobacillus chungangensis]RDW19347.1 hypothetical protein CWR45_07885 [Oceanobacillus chungangensis]
MMKDNHVTIEENLIHSEADYLHFFQSLLQLLTHYIEELHFYSITDRKRYVAEKHILSSLFLIEKLHMHLLTRKTFFHKNEVISEANVFTDNTHGIIAFQTLRKFKKLTREYKFSDDSNNQQCERILRQLLNYYPQYVDQIRIMEGEKIPSPWRSPRKRKQRN